MGNNTAVPVRVPLEQIYSRWSYVYKISSGCLSSQRPAFSSGILQANLKVCWGKGAFWGFSLAGGSVAFQSMHWIIYILKYWWLAYPLSEKEETLVSPWVHWNFMKVNKWLEWCPCSTHPLVCWGDPTCFICKGEHYPFCCSFFAQELGKSVMGCSQALVYILGLWLLWFILICFDLSLAPAAI